ncbi:MAG: cysteine--tRNA ligase [Phycisphaerae bacterium]|nr:MAG: cysteine--tRNA ligase [Phycisphaerae bacterium]
MPLRLYNSLTKQVEDFVPADPAHVTFYTCGPTVYDDAHIGNFRSFLAADLLRRFIESPLCELRTKDGGVHHGPRRVTHVMNITDVGHMTDDAEGGEAGEDRMAVAGRRIAEAKKAGTLPMGVEVDPRDPYAIAKFYEGRFREDAKRLGLKVSIEAERDESLHPKATANVPGMIAVIARLIAGGYAYVGGRPGARAVYFDVQKYGPYGRLSGNTLERLRAGEGGRVSASNQAEKKHPADFLLWKEDPAHLMKWDSPWGWGYPGWHIECSVMSLRARLGRGVLPQDIESLAVANGGALIDLHSGGEDNIFPHHECEIAQSCCAFNADPAGGSFASMWFHPRFLLVEGAKMSKSKGNFFTARDLFAKGIEPAALRLELIKTHYRSNANFTMQGLADSQRMVERWRRIAGDFSSRRDGGGALTPVLRDVAGALHDDLNIAEAVAAINAWAGSVELGPITAATMSMLDGVLGVLSLERPQAQQTAIGVFNGVAPSPEVEALLAQRRDARARKDFKASDAIRDQLAGMGYAIKDLPGGKVEVRRA